MPNERRPKAQDVFSESTPFFVNFFGRKGSFQEAFPRVDELKVTVKEEGKGVQGGHATTAYRKDTSGEFINCSNPLCYSGGFHLAAILGDMTYADETQWNGSRGCLGYEGSPKGRVKYGPCSNTFEVSVEITYNRRGLLKLA